MLTEKDIAEAERGLEERMAELEAIGEELKGAPAGESKAICRAIHAISQNLASTNRLVLTLVREVGALKAGRGPDA